MDPSSHINIKTWTIQVTKSLKRDNIIDCVYAFNKGHICRISTCFKAKIFSPCPPPPPQLKLHMHFSNHPSMTIFINCVYLLLNSNDLACSKAMPLIRDTYAEFQHVSKLRYSVHAPPPTTIKTSHAFQ